jgi:hypothetical protein
MVRILFLPVPGYETLSDMLLSRKELGGKPNLEVSFGPSTSLKAGLLAASLSLVLFSFVLLATDSADFFGSLKQRETKNMLNFVIKYIYQLFVCLQREWNAN